MSLVVKWVKSFFAFWWDFIVGDDVTLAIGVLVGIGAVAALQAASVVSWWALPAAWVVALLWSLGRATRHQPA